MGAMQRCDFEDCAAPGVSLVELRRDEVSYHADLCADHSDVVMATVAFRPALSTLYGKARDVYRAKSGKPFSAIEARQWLIKKGLKPKGATGRLSKEHLDLYASKH